MWCYVSIFVAVYRSIIFLGDWNAMHFSCVNSSMSRFRNVIFEWTFRTRIYGKSFVSVRWNLWKSNEYYTTWVSVCSLRYPASNAHAPCCHLWPAPLYYIFPHYLINGRTLEKKKVTEYKMCVFLFSTTLSEILLVLIRTERDMIKKLILFFMYITLYSCSILIALEFSWQIFEKSSNIKFHENPLVRTELFYADGRTDRRTDMTKLIVAFRNFAKAPESHSLWKNEEILWPLNVVLFLIEQEKLSDLLGVSQWRLSKSSLWTLQKSLILQTVFFQRFLKTNLQHLLKLRKLVHVFQ